MKKYIKSLFNTGGKEESGKRGFADFFLNATPKEKERVFTEAARKANEDQRKFLKLEPTR